MKFHIKGKCLELYQPLQELSVDERMVKSKARTHVRQYIKDKPTKLGFKYWVIADPTTLLITSTVELHLGTHQGKHFHTRLLQI